MNLPHACGDEPLPDLLNAAVDMICPTHVGMNRGNHMDGINDRHLPHACGDEP